MDEMAEQLTERLAVDLDDGFTELVRLHATVVRAFLLRVTGSAAEADDLGQDTFLRAYTALRGYSPERRRALRPRAWLMTIAANTWRNQVRTAVRHPVSAVPVEDSCGAWADARPGPEERASASHDRGCLVSALAELPEKPRVAVVLRHVVGMSYGEIAEAQGCPVGTVKAQVSRGIGSLRLLLEGRDDPPMREVVK
ncbi:RNA polymerase sigma factor [Streptomyces sp. NPDC006632]|uniref:RNA polymerase sigma factor n=1 Tax=unclassified Streptomyces TaxID=2593676 RepID=UPI002E22DF01